MGNMLYAAAVAVTIGIIFVIVSLIILSKRARPNKSVALGAITMVLGIALILVSSFIFGKLEQDGKSGPSDSGEGAVEETDLSESTLQVAPSDEWTDDIPYQAEVVLSQIAEDMAKQATQNPGTVKMKALTMGFANKGNIYAVQSEFECSNLMGVTETHTIRVLCEANEDQSKIQPYEVYLDGVLISSLSS